MQMKNQNKLFIDYLKLEKKCDDLEAENEELKGKIEYLKEQLENEIQYREDNFKMIPEMELYGLNENDFH